MTTWVPNKLIGEKADNKLKKGEKFKRNIHSKPFVEKKTRYFRNNYARYLAEPNENGIYSQGILITKAEKVT
jgi:hypothetical protein